MRDTRTGQASSLPSLIVPSRHRHPDIKREASEDSLALGQTGRQMKRRKMDGCVAASGPSCTAAGSMSGADVHLLPRLLHQSPALHFSHSYRIPHLHTDSVLLTIYFRYGGKLSSAVDPKHPMNVTITKNILF